VLQLSVAEHLVAFVEMVQVGAAETACRCSNRRPDLAAPSQRRLTGIANLQHAARGEQVALRALRVGNTQSNMSMPRADGIDQILGRADTHQIAWPFGRQLRPQMIQRPASPALGSPTDSPPIA
jgi:hypothetical protein